MPDRIMNKTKEKRISKINVIDIYLLVFIILGAITVSVWMMMFLNFGKNIESYKQAINSQQNKIISIQKEIEVLDQQIEKYSEVIEVLERK